MISAAIILLALSSSLILIEPIAALGAVALFSASYLIIARLVRKRLDKNAEVISIESSRSVQFMQEGLGGIREVVISRAHDFFALSYKGAISPLFRAGANNRFISMSPRYIIEGIGLAAVAFLAYWYSTQSGGFGAALPVLGALGFAAQRMLPVVQQLFNAWSAVRGSSAILKDVLFFLEKKRPDVYSEITADSLHQAVRFEKTIEASEISFRFSDSGSLVLKNINLTIPKGSCIGIVGTTGSGKSTLIDILMGLLPPTSGSVRVDGVMLEPETLPQWFDRITHVPQSIFLSDAPILNNVAFGKKADQIDRHRVEWAIEKAQLREFLEQLPKGLDTVVGERGVRLSGGQRQRLGIARALYQDAELITLDEATSALDSATEEKVMEALNELGEGLTVIIIAHRLSTLKHCDLVIKLQNGEVVAIGSYEEIIANMDSAT